MRYSYLFGPVSSRRLGLSLGVDLLPFKTCTLDCVYCELGATTRLTSERREYVPTEAVMAELDDYLREAPPLDYITFAGSGEPLLHTGIGVIIRHLKAHHPGYKVALLTNGTLFCTPGVIDEIADVDLVVPSLDAVSEEIFTAVNRPAPGLTSGTVLEGLKLFFAQYKGEVWLELFVVPGVNDSPAEMERLAALVHRLGPARTQLNSLDRPGTEAWVENAGIEYLKAIAPLFPGGEVVSRGRVSRGQRPVALLESVTASLKRRPQTMEDLAGTLDAHPLEIEKALSTLAAEGRIKSEPRGDALFYVWHTFFESPDPE